MREVNLVLKHLHIEIKSHIIIITSACDGKKLLANNY